MPKSPIPSHTPSNGSYGMATDAPSSQASLSVMVDLVEGKTVDEAMKLAETFHKFMESRGKGLNDEQAEESLEDGIVFQGSPSIRCASNARCSAGRA